MRKHDLIFSNRPVYRIQRHLYFWMARFFLIFLYSYGTPLLSFLTTGETWYLENIQECYQVGTFRLFIDLLYCYSVVYWLMPRFLYKKKYTLFGVLLGILTLTSFAANTIFAIQYYKLLDEPTTTLYKTIWYQGIHFILGGSPVVCIGFLAIKLLKTWYQEEEKKVAITSANANAELQLLKAQIHPHFLFNTLNNIYSFTLAGHPRAGALADQLSGMMDYMSIEGEKEWVPVEKEIRLIQDYMSLEKVRYDERLDIMIEITGDYKNKLVAPLLLIPFAENCFKHGASVMRGKQWVRLDISVQDNILRFDLSNSKPASAPSRQHKNGIGLMNVKKRLQLIYPGQHTLLIETSETVYRVHLNVKLMQQPVIPAADQSLYQQQTPSYA